MSSALTVTDLQQALPKNTHSLLDQTLVDQINNCIADPDAMEHYRNNLISYGAVIKTGRFKLVDYLNAVRYVTFKMMGLTNRDSFAATFPEKMKSYAARKFSEKDINSYVSAYNKGKLVTSIIQVAMIPVYVANADIFQKAVNVQAQIMSDLDVSPKVRSDAANSLMTHLKPPEVAKVEMDVTVKDDDTLKDLKDTLYKLAHAQADSITLGQSTAKEIAHAAILPKKVEQDL